jgi:hypothetical protein
MASDALHRATTLPVQPPRRHPAETAAAVLDAHTALRSCATALEQLGHSVDTLLELSDAPEVGGLANALAATGELVDRARAGTTPIRGVGYAAATLARRATDVLRVHADQSPGPTLVRDLPRGLLDLHAALGRRLRETGRLDPRRTAGGRTDPGVAAHAALDDLVAAYRRHQPRSGGRVGGAAGSAAVAVAYAVANAGLATLVRDDDDGYAPAPWPRPLPPPA